VMPHQVWYTPFVPIKGLKVANTLSNRYSDATSGLNAAWSFGEANSSFAGSFVM
jgi:hypothetical protein